MVSKVIDLDTLVEREVHDAAQSGYLPFYVENNNYFNYRVEQIMSSDYVSFNLKQRRTAHCNYCDPILIHISEPWDQRLGKLFTEPLFFVEKE